MSNNKRIKESIEDFTKFHIEQFEADKIITWNEGHKFLEIINKMIKKRLKDGALKYQLDVPITGQECLDADRNNAKEMLEELIDALVYGTARYLRVKRDAEKYYRKHKQHIASDIQENMRRSLTHVTFACLSLMKSTDDYYIKQSKGSLYYPAFYGYDEKQSTTERRHNNVQK